LCDGFYPLFLDPGANPGRYDGHADAIRREAERIGRDLGGFTLMAFVSARLLESSFDGSSRPICTGNAEQFLEDLQEFARRGYSRCSLHLDVPSGTVTEMLEIMHAVSASVIPSAHSLGGAFA
jgi:hypothetical protein